MTTRRPVRSWRERRGAVLEHDHGQGGDVGGLGQPARPGVGAGEPADRGRQHDRAAAAQRGDVVLRGRVQPHLGVHRRHEHDRAGRGEQGGGEQVVGAAGGGAGQQVGGGRRDDDEVGVLPDPHVGDLGDVGPDVGGDRVARTAPRRWRRRRSAAPPGVGTTRTSWPASVNARSTKAALYAATPPLTPSTIRLMRLILPQTRRRPRWRLTGVPSSPGSLASGSGAAAGLAQFSPAVWVSRPSLISRSAIDRGFSCGAVSTSGPTYSSRPSESWL